MDATPYEIWKPVVGWEDFYEVSDLGRVRSRDRAMTSLRGKEWVKKGRVLRGFMSAGSVAKRYVMVSLTDGDRREIHYVHRLVLEAFVGPCTPGWVTRHLDDNQHDNRLVNLAYGTYGDNLADRMVNTGHHYGDRTHCPNGHAYTLDNTYRRTDSNGGNARRCRRCAREKYHAKKMR